MTSVIAIAALVILGIWYVSVLFKVNGNDETCKSVDDGVGCGGNERKTEEGQKTEIKSGRWRTFGLNLSRHLAELAVGEEAPARPMDCQLRGPTRSTPHELFLITLHAQRRRAATRKTESATARPISRHSEIWRAQSSLSAHKIPLGIGTLATPASPAAPCHPSTRARGELGNPGARPFIALGFRTSRRQRGHREDVEAWVLRGGRLEGSHAMGLGLLRLVVVATAESRSSSQGDHPTSEISRVRRGARSCSA